MTVYDLMRKCKVLHKGPFSVARLSCVTPSLIQMDADMEWPMGSFSF